jgi:hypothetical protein
MGGIGKTVLATALARDEEVRKAFPDGVLWVTFGQTPQILTWQSYLASALGDKQEAFTEVGLAKARLRELFAEKACLLILDDIWRLDDATAFDVLGERCQMLITTRDGVIVTGLGGEEYQLAVLEEQQALELLADWANQPEILQPSPHNDITLQVARECGYLPLALAMVGAMMRGKPANRWQNILEKLRSADLEKIKQQFPDYPYPDLLKAIAVSVREGELQELLCDFRWLQGKLENININVLLADYDVLPQDENLKLIKGALRLSAHILNEDKQTLKVWNWQTGEVIASFIGDGAIYCCAVAPDGVRVVAGDVLGRVHFLRLQGKQE